MSSTSTDLPLQSQGNTDVNDNSNNSGGGSGASSSLYLFTFLATLLLLLTVSCAIVIRSFIMRRRFRRTMEQALASGAILPQDAFRGTNHFNGFGGGRRGTRYFGEKPKMWDINVVKGEEYDIGDEKWDDMKPISARIVQYYNHGEHYASGFAVNNDNNLVLISSNSTIDDARRDGLFGRLNPFKRRHNANTADNIYHNNIIGNSIAASPHLGAIGGITTESVLEPQPTQNHSNNTVPSFSSGPALASPIAPTAATVQVSVLIAMPSPHNPVHCHSHLSRQHAHASSSSSGSGARLSSGTDENASSRKGKARSLDGRSGASRIGGNLNDELNVDLEEEQLEDEELENRYQSRNNTGFDSSYVYEHEVPDVAIGIAQLPLRHSIASSSVPVTSTSAGTTVVQPGGLAAFDTRLYPDKGLR